MRKLFVYTTTLLLLSLAALAQQKNKPAFKVLAFFTAKNDLAHISYVHEANKWFPAAAAKYHFQYDSTNDWSKLNADTLSQYQVVLFLDTRPEVPAQRAAFRQYMEKGGGWIGFHFAAFGLTPSDVPQNWDWFHNTFLGSGQFVSNTWHPTPAILRVEDAKSPVTKGLPPTFKTAPNEWYRWEHDLRKNPGIDILLAVDSSSFPLGTGPKPQEIWHSGYYPVVWTNRHFHMVYINMGHNDMDYDGGTNRQLSSTFSSPDQDKMLINALFFVAGVKH
ncbi:ThuA domain-containing protein [Chitinophaga parva]|uniref:ThuA domain-containing protein n=1 Tax=Chitinophaga parva TaxID=2169414 RepID=A0A2T7BCB2_9BACT|nr:ThuA domain-containing protein [Chitinophaga parva]PUZ22739.1 ThuA domain-containing protein [Chitinophaga parva]